MTPPNTCWRKPVPGKCTACFWNPAQYHVVFGCLDGDISDGQWCIQCVHRVSEAIRAKRTWKWKDGDGMHWGCLKNHPVADLIYEPVNSHEYSLNGRRQRYDYKGFLVT